METLKPIQNIKKSGPENGRLAKIVLPLGTLAFATLGCRGLETGDIIGSLIIMVGFPLLIYGGAKVFFGNSSKKK